MSWDIFLDSMPELLEAALATLRMTALSFLLAATLGLAIAILRTTRGGVGRIAFLYIEVVRGMPALTLLFLIYFGLAPLGIVLNTFAAAVVALGLNGAAYLAEVYRAGIQAVEFWWRLIALLGEIFIAGVAFCAAADVHGRQQHLERLRINQEAVVAALTAELAGLNGELAAIAHETAALASGLHPQV